jgi:hypothetical protein
MTARLVSDADIGKGSKLGGGPDLIPKGWLAFAHR